LFFPHNGHSSSAGTGLLGVALSEFVSRYTITDIEDLIPLIRKNVILNFPNWSSSSHIPGKGTGGNIHVESLDWIVLEKTPAYLRERNFSFMPPIDLLLVIDCIYHTSLLPPLVESIDYLSTPDHTAVLVVVELRSDDVIRSFLELWIAKPGWKIWRLGREGNLDRPYIMWVGWKTLSSENI
jgi:hypothetical protein